MSHYDTTIFDHPTFPVQMHLNSFECNLKVNSYQEFHFKPVFIRLLNICVTFQTFISLIFYFIRNIVIKNLNSFFSENQ